MTISIRRTCTVNLGECRARTCRLFPVSTELTGHSTVWGVHVANPLTGSPPDAAGPICLASSRTAMAFEIEVTSLGWRVRSFAPRRILRPMRFALLANGGAGPDRHHDRQSERRVLRHRPLRDDRQHHGKWPTC